MRAKTKGKNNKKGIKSKKTRELERLFSRLSNDKDLNKILKESIPLIKSMTRKDSRLDRDALQTLNLSSSFCKLSKQAGRVASNTEEDLSENPGVSNPYTVNNIDPIIDTLAIKLGIDYYKLLQALNDLKLNLHRKF